MGGKQTRTGEYIYLCVTLLIVLALWGCVSLKKTKERVEEERPSLTKADESTEARKYLRHGRELLARGDYEGALAKNQNVLSLFRHQPRGDEALFNMGLIYAHFGNPKRDYGKSLGFFKKLMKDYPQSPWVEQGKIWIALILENEKLSHIIEQSKKVDIEIEEKKREKGK